MASGLCACVCFGSVLMGGCWRSAGCSLKCKTVEPAFEPDPEPGMGNTSPRVAGLLRVLQQEVQRVQRRRSWSVIGMAGGETRPMGVSEPEHAKDKSKMQRILGGGGLLPLEVVRAKAAEAMKAGWDWDLDDEPSSGSSVSKKKLRKSYSENEVDNLQDLDDGFDGIMEIQGHTRTGTHEVIQTKRTRGFSIIKNSLAILREDLGEDLAIAQGKDSRYKSLNQEAEQGLLSSPDD